MPKHESDPTTSTTKSQEDLEGKWGEYLSVVRQIYEHIRLHDPKTLTELRRLATLRKEKARK